MAFAAFDTQLGTCAVVWSDAGIRRLFLPERDRDETLRRVRALCGDIPEGKPPRVVRAAMRGIERRLAGQATAIEALLDLDQVSPFARKIYAALSHVGPGQTVTYGELAARVGSKGAARAVGRAMASNPVPVLIPCHRVLAANGKPGGFTAYGGVATKARLLALEGVKLDASEVSYDVNEALRALRRADPELGKLIERVGPFRLARESAKSTFASLARAIVYQQLTGRAAATIFGRVVALFPKQKTLRAQDVASASEETLRSAGLSRAKAAALSDLAEKTLAGSVPSLRALEAMDDAAIVESLTKVRGIGPWTVEMLLIFQLGRPDVLPLGDYGVRKGFSLTFGHDEVVPPKVLAAHGERWRPYRSVASWYLWRALEL